jgi:hypothetical protein
VFGQNKCIGAWPQSATGNTQDGGVTVQDFVHLVPMLLCTCTKEINRRKVDRTFHGSKFVVDVLWLRPHNDSSPVLSKTLNAAQLQNAPVAMPQSVFESRF